MDLNTKITLDTAINMDKLEEVIEYYNNKNKQEKHLKGYIFDSLVYRYKDALRRAYIYQSRWERTECNEKAFNRDLMRFIQILDEAIGEHD